MIFFTAQFDQKTPHRIHDLAYAGRREIRLGQFRCAPPRPNRLALDTRLARR